MTFSPYLSRLVIMRTLPDVVCRRSWATRVLRMRVRRLLLRVVKRMTILAIYFHPVPFAQTPLSWGLPLGCRWPPVLRPAIFAPWRSRGVMGAPLPVSYR